jgi:predicted transcriptional regulator of viral defense system
VGWGLYRLADRPPSEHQTLIEAAKRVPNGVVCLLSALHFHGLGTQLPREIWMAIDRKAWKPDASGPPLRLVRFSGQGLSAGARTHRLDGVKVRVYEPAKTVADCFKYRNKIGLDVAVEALRDCREQRKCSMHDLWRYAKIDRVANVIRPYLEAVG